MDISSLNICFCILATLLLQVSCQTTEEPGAKFTYEEMLKMRKGLEEKLIGTARGLKRYSYLNHVPPGGSQVKKDEEKNILYVITDVQVVVSVQRIDVMDVNSQTLKFAAEIALGWVDSNLKWDYNVTTFPILNMAVAPNDFWTPELLPADIIGYDYIPSSLTPSMTVFYHGTVISKVSATLTIPCDVNVLAYPFDTHHCYLGFTQKFDPSTRVNFIAVPANEKSTSGLLFNKAHRHREWDLKYLNSSSVEDGEIYHLEIVLRRKAVFYAIVLIMPCLVLNLITFLMFVVSVEGTERIDLALNLILSYLVLLLILVDSIPPSGGDIPLLGFYVMMSMIIVVFAMIGSIVLIRLNRRKEAGKPAQSAFKPFFNKFRIFKFCGSNKTRIEQNNNPSGAGKGNDDENEADSESARRLGAIIYNLNFILFVITLILHIVMLIGVCVIWVSESE